MVFGYQCDVFHKQVGVLGLKARDLIGFSFVQLLVHTPLVLFLLWILGSTLTYTPPMHP